MLSRLVEQVGFAWATRISGLLILVACGITTAILQARLKPKKGQSVRR
jgi:hypothetical protein